MSSLKSGETDHQTLKLAPAPHGEAVPQVREVIVDAFAGEGHVVKRAIEARDDSGW